VARQMEIWDKPEIPDWMNSISDNSTVTYEEIAPIFKRTYSSAFRKAFIARYGDMHVVSQPRTCAVSKGLPHKARLRIKMGDIRNLVAEINSAE